jgi:hypothetical protein
METLNSISMTKILSVFFFLVGATVMAQVGINTTSTPVAQLEIQDGGASLPALKLTPQTNPSGTETGQLAVIGDQLYMYNATRTKWLSIESEMMMFGENSARVSG